MSRTSTHVLEPANPATQASGSCSTSLFVSNVNEHSPPKRATVEQFASPPGSTPRRSPTKRMLHLVRRIDFKRIIPSFSRPSEPLQTEGSQISSTSTSSSHPRRCSIRILSNIFRAAKLKFQTPPSLPPTSHNKDRPKTPPSIIISPPSPHRLQPPSPTPPPSAYTKPIINNDLPSRPPSPPTTPPARISPSSSHSSLPSLINDGRSSIDSDTLRPPTPPPRFAFDIFEPRSGVMIVGGDGWPYLARFAAMPVPTNVNVSDEAQRQRQQLGQQQQQQQNQPQGGQGDTQQRETENDAHISDQPNAGRHA